MLPKQLFYNTGIPACLWFLSRDKAREGERNRKGETLFVDASEKGFMEDRTHRKFTDQDIAEIAGMYHKWRLAGNDYKDLKGFCKAETIEGIKKNDWVLTPGRYVGIPDEVNDGIPFKEKMSKLMSKLKEQLEKEKKLNVEIENQLSSIGFRIS
jgi:type I restriction enzyme M protein